MERLKQYLPMEPYGEAVLLAVQINFFSCGGTAIGMCLSHKIADGTSLVTFINAWASTCRGVSDQIVQPRFDLAQHFPPKDLSGTSLTPNIGLTSEKIVTKRFIFDKERVAALREAVIGSQLIKTPTRVEAVSAYIWKHFMEVAKGKMIKKKMFGALHAVNLRPRTSPPLSQHAFGNCWTPAIALFTADDNNKHEYEDLAKELGKVIREIDSDYIEQMQNEEYLINLSKLNDLVYVDGEVEVCNFSSWCRFPIYEVNYGWGKPLWVCTTTLPIKNLAILMSTKTGDGIEAWVNMLEDDVDKFDFLG
ncbi:HXXXD-type acyl-transferase family protein [Forsythia ovata]|uniref:HXXXD-type acyl-transferase family protein n=1 Tax=Forsythia ovata TaxID=205694 RepID=A0ABD1P6T2_9LAMI